RGDHRRGEQVGSGSCGDPGQRSEHQVGHSVAMLDESLGPPPARGRTSLAGRRLRPSDADPTGRPRLDACARYLQDIGNDDTADSGIDDPRTTWVVRRAVVDVHQAPRWREPVAL